MLHISNSRFWNTFVERYRDNQSTLNAWTVAISVLSTIEIFQISSYKIEAQRFIAKLCLARSLHARHRQPAAGIALCRNLFQRCLPHGRNRTAYDTRRQNRTHVGCKITKKKWNGQRKQPRITYFIKNWRIKRMGHKSFLNWFKMLFPSTGDINLQKSYVNIWVR